jgi:hypothetical protein
MFRNFGVVLFCVSKARSASIFKVNIPSRGPVLSWNAWSVEMMALSFSETSRTSTQRSRLHVGGVKTSENLRSHKISELAFVIETGVLFFWSVSSILDINSTFCVFWPCILKIVVMKANLMHYLSLMYFVNQPLHVSGLFIAHHQEVFTVYVQQLVRVIRLRDWQLVRSGWNSWPDQQRITVPIAVHIQDYSKWLSGI